MKKPKFIQKILKILIAEQIGYAMLVLLAVLIYLIGQMIS